MKPCSWCGSKTEGIMNVFGPVPVCSDRCEQALSDLLDGVSLDEVKRDYPIEKPIMHPLELELRTWLQNWKTAAAMDLEHISVEAKTNGLINVHLAAEEFLDANWGGNKLEPVVERCFAILDIDKTK